MSPDARRQMDELERQRPDPAKNPDEFARVNDEISRLIDEERAYRNASKGFRVA